MKLEDLRDKVGWYCRAAGTPYVWRIAGYVEPPLNPRPIVYLAWPRNSRAPWNIVSPEDITEVWHQPVIRSA